jgi:hypothetical protein
VAAARSPGRILVPIYVSTFLEATSYALVIIALPFRFRQLGLPIVEYGIAAAAYSGGLLVMESLWGYFAFRIARPSILLGLGAGVVLLFLAVGASSTFLEFSLSLAAIGLVIVYPVPIMRWLALRGGGPGTEATGTGRLGFFFGAGLVVGSAMAPLLFEAAGYFVVSLVCGGLFVAGATALASLPWSTVGLPGVGPGLWGEVRSVFTREFAIGSLLVALYFTVITLVTNFAQYYSVDLFHGTDVESGYLIASVRGISVVVGFLLGPLVDRFGAPRSVPPGFLLLVAGTLGIWVSGTYLEMLAFSVVFSIGVGWLGASLLPLALATVPASAQGTAIGIFGSFEDVGLLVGPLVISATYAAYGARSIFPVVGAIAAAGVLIGLAYLGKARAAPSPPGSSRQERA